MLDVLITDALVCDGSGAPARRGDIGIRAGRIVADTEGERARRVVDASGLVAAPGFIDIHTHLDAQLQWDPAGTPSPQHGFTTVVGGNCGFALAPVVREYAEYLMRMMATVEGMPYEALAAAASWDAPSFGGWLDAFDGKIAVNAGFLAGHSTVRLAAMGLERRQEAATDDDVARMTAVLDDCLAQGALGFSSSRTVVHNDADGYPVPSRAASIDELLALTAAVGRHPGTTLQMNTAGTMAGFGDDEIAWLAECSRRADRPVNWNILSIDASEPGFHSHQLTASDYAAAHGGHVVAVTLPAFGGGSRSRITFASPIPLGALPGWAELYQLPEHERGAALLDPSFRAKLRAGAAAVTSGKWMPFADFANYTIAEGVTPEVARHDGRRVGDIAADEGRDPFDVLVDLVVADGLQTGLHPGARREPGADERARLAANTRAMQREVWRDPRTVVGGSDAGAHLDIMCGATFSTSLLARGVREQQIISLEEAVHQLTDVPARLYGMRDRGRIHDGYAADVVLFDPAVVAPEPLEKRTDLPGGAWRMYAGAIGIERVLVNGVDILVRGELTGERPGRVLRSGVDTDTITVAEASRAAREDSEVSA